MRRIEHISSSALSSQLSLFNHNDLSNLLFNNKKPFYKTYPFKKLTGSPLEKASVIYKISMYNDSKELYEYVNDAIYSINGCVMEEGCNILELDLMLFRYLVNGFVEGAAAWQEWVLQEMAGYVKTVVSDVYWKTLKRGGGSVFFKAFPTVEQQFWITQNEHKEEESLVHLILNIRESVLPFMNPDLWKRTKDYEKNRRDNSEYENQRNDMLTGKFFEKNTNVKKEDALDTLDIIQ